MKHNRLSLAVGLGLGATVGLALLVPMAHAGIANTKHNLGSDLGTVNNNFVSGDGNLLNGEICVFCHTPHGANTSVEAPLWNKFIQNSTGYTVYTSSTLDATTRQPQGVSLACLSCHDGNQAMDVIINAPGSGGAAADITAANRTFTWTSENSSLTGDALTSGIAALGKNLKNDHPVSILYAGGLSGAAGKNYADATLKTDYKDTDFVVNQGTAGGRKWIDTKSWTSLGGYVTNTATTLDKNDMPLYGDQATDTVAYVECATCHDPHRETKTFLRVDTGNDGSAICLSCHDK